MNNPREDELKVTPINEEEKARRTNHWKKNLKLKNQLANNTTCNHESSWKLEQAKDKIKQLWDKYEEHEYCQLEEMT